MTWCCVDHTVHESVDTHGHTNSKLNYISPAQTFIHIQQSDCLLSMWPEVPITAVVQDPQRQGGVSNTGAHTHAHTHTHTHYNVPGAEVTWGMHLHSVVLCGLLISCCYHQVTERNGINTTLKEGGDRMERIGRREAIVSCYPNFNVARPDCTGLPFIS